MKETNGMKWVKEEFFSVIFIQEKLIMGNMLDMKTK